MIKSYHAEFFTATILRWQKLLHDNNLKQIIIDSLQWLVTEKRCSVYAFVIMRCRKIINGHRLCFMKKISLNHTTG